MADPCRVGLKLNSTIRTPRQGWVVGEYFAARQGLLGQFGGWAWLRAYAKQLTNQGVSQCCMHLSECAQGGE